MFEPFKNPINTPWKIKAERRKKERKD